jgi:hypothetical protein
VLQEQSNAHAHPVAPSEAHHAPFLRRRPRTAHFSPFSCGAILGWWYFLARVLPYVTNHLWWNPCSFPIENKDLNEVIDVCQFASFKSETGTLSP